MVYKNEESGVQILIICTPLFRSSFPDEMDDFLMGNDKKDSDEYKKEGFFFVFTLDNS